jgi:hypothetical protein
VKRKQITKAKSITELVIAAISELVLEGKCSPAEKWKDPKARLVMPGLESRRSQGHWK